MPFFRDLIKDIIREELEAGAQPTGADTGAEPPTTPAQPQEATSNNTDDKNTTPNADTAKQGADEAKKAIAENSNEFNVELRKIIRKEVRDFAADQLNREAGTGATQGVDVNNVYCSLLGFPTQQKGGK